MKFYGRTEELVSLRKVRDISRNFARFTVVTGRRRIGMADLTAKTDAFFRKNPELKSLRMNFLSLSLADV